MILVTGAAGKTGRLVVSASDRRGARIRALVRGESQLGPVLESGAHEVVVGDMRDPQTIRKATEGVRAVYHICPNMLPDEVGIGEHGASHGNEIGFAFCKYVFGNLGHVDAVAGDNGDVDFFA